jgi:hypothetical protein
MSAVALRMSRPAEPVAVLEARAEARALRFADGDLGLHDAVDELQRFADGAGLIDCLGQDRVQQIIAAAFAPHRDDLDQVRQAQRETVGLHEGGRPKTGLTDNPVSTPTLVPESLLRIVARNRRLRPTPAVTVDAVVYSVQQRGLAALEESANIARLLTFDHAAFQQLDQHLERMGIATDVE